jgi:septal ring factor EnvC (AmiA/AmiB activator)
MSWMPRTTTINAGTGRHALTILAVVASLAIGFLSIRAAAAWATVAAPLDTSPVSVQRLQSRLADETARARALEERLGALTTHADAVESALAAAEARLVSDSAHADDLSAQLATAKAKLAALERSIRDANRVRLTRLATSPSTTGAGGGEHEGVGDD